MNTRPMHARNLVPLALAVALAACSAEKAPPPAAPPVADTAPTTDVPPAPPATPTGELPSGQPDGDADLASFRGYDALAFGTAAADMARAWGGELKELGKDYNDQCYFMNPAWVKTPSEFNFMVGDGKFVRFGTDSARFVAPGGGKVGMTRAEVAALYPALKASPHKYVDGEYLEVADPAGGNALLIFETDAKGDAAKVTEWRIGTPPHVGYVEGCS